jgi:predicted naringenin-chalcone synthase
MDNEDPNAEMKREICEQINRKDSNVSCNQLTSPIHLTKSSTDLSQKPDWFLEKVMATLEKSVRRKMEQDVESALKADETAIEEPAAKEAEVVTVDKAAVEKKKEKQKATTIKVTGVGVSTAAKGTISSADQDSSDDELAGVVLSLDRQVKTLMKA